MTPEESAAVADSIRTVASPDIAEIIDLPLIDLALADFYAGVVKALEPHWISRGEGTFFTIGASTYNDLIISDGHAAYYEVAEKNNELIQDNFGPLLDVVKYALGRHFKREVIDLPGMAAYAASKAGLVGFHIFADGVERNPNGGHIHTDEPFQRLLWTEPFANPFSFSVALELPRGIGGMDYWDKGTEEIYFPYEIGRLYVHNGRFPHRISSIEMPNKERPRITLQGHGALLLDTNRIAVYF